jgi:hypothetical protein
MKAIDELLFHRSKMVIRNSLEGCTDEKLAFLFASAQDGMMPWRDAGCCYAAQFTGYRGIVFTSLSDAYYRIGLPISDALHASAGDDGKRHRRLAAMIKAQMRLRDRRTRARLGLAGAAMKAYRDQRVSSPALA